MNNRSNFIPRNGSPLFYPGGPESGLGGGGNGVSRRKFLKRTGGVTAGALIAAINLRNLQADVGDHVSVDSDLSAGSFYQRRYWLHCKEVPERLQETTTWLLDVPGATHEDVVLTRTDKCMAKAEGPNVGEAAPSLDAIKAFIKVKSGPHDGDFWFASKIPILRRNGALYNGEWLEDNDAQKPIPGEMDGPENLPSTGGLTVSVSSSVADCRMMHSVLALTSFSTQSGQNKNESNHWRDNVEASDEASSEKAAFDQSTTSASVGGSASQKNGIGLTTDLNATNLKNFSSKSSVSEKRDYEREAGATGSDFSNYTVKKTYDVKVHQDSKFAWKIRVIRQRRKVDILTQKVTWEGDWEEVTDDDWSESYQSDPPPAPEPEEGGGSTAP
jgi:hypothetical protein